VKAFSNSLIHTHIFIYVNLQHSRDLINNTKSLFHTSYGLCINTNEDWLLFSTTICNSHLFLKNSLRNCRVPSWKGIIKYSCLYVVSWIYFPWISFSSFEMISNNYLQEAINKIILQLYSTRIIPIPLKYLGLWVFVNVFI